MSAQNEPHFQIADDLLPKIKPGEYDVGFVDYYTDRMFKGKAHKLIMYFRIVTMGEYNGIVLPRYYNVSNVAPKKTKGGNFKAGQKGDFLREYCTLFPSPIKRRDRIPMSVFNRVIIRAEVSTVERARGREIPEELQYSRIEKLLGVKT